MKEANRDKAESAAAAHAGTDESLDWMERMEDVPDVLSGYEPTEEDWERMEKNPQKYLRFAVYLANAIREPPGNNAQKRAREGTDFLANQFVEDHIKFED